MAADTTDRPFAELPAALIDELLERTEGLGRTLLADFDDIRGQRAEWRRALAAANLLSRDCDLPYVPIPTTCAVDGSYAVERLLASDLVAAAAVAVEGLTPPSEKRYWPEPRHRLVAEMEGHNAGTATILRALMMGMELILAAHAPHELVLLDGSLTTPLIYLNQALNMALQAPQLRVAGQLQGEVISYLTAYHSVITSERTDRCWLAIPKYTTLREIGQALGWPERYDDRGLLSQLLEPGEFTRPTNLQQPSEPWHLNLNAVPPAQSQGAHGLAANIIASLADVRVIYYRPYPWLAALRIETGRAVAENSARLATVLHGIRHQCGTPAAMEPFPLYLADRMVKHLPKAIPAFRQVTTQHIADAYDGDISDVFLALHGYRTESGA